MSAFDVIIIGAGHNGLVAANYLARAGKSVCVLEARSVVGGACVTEVLLPGAHVSSCAFVQGMLRPEIIDELELGKFGLTSIAPDTQGFGLWEDGDHIMLHEDVDATLQSIEAHSTAPVPTYPDRGYYWVAQSLRITGAHLSGSRLLLGRAIFSDNRCPLIRIAVIIGSRDLFG
jgi:phytoene dehydrogenase-like protein